ncbi:peptidoglycan-binding protein [Rhodobacteraceae bacterium NNCM2]|nr:peptidoglycan-binding protein [Coraliihabitans acroporae]
MAFAGAGLFSVLVTVFLLNDPYWKLAALEAPSDDTADVVAELFNQDEVLDDTKVTEDPITFAFSDISVKPEAPVGAATGVPVMPDPIADRALDAPSDLQPVDYAQHPEAAQPVVDLDDATMLAQSQATRGFDAPFLEDKLELTQGQRAVVQRRLVLAGHDPKGVDGIFGDETRAAIASFQEEMGLPPTGFLDAPAMIALTDTTQKSYVAWRKERDRRRALLAINVQPEPRPAPYDTNGRTERCDRTQSGQIIAYQSMVCDLTGFAESFWRSDKRGGAENERLAELSTPADR